MKEFYFSIIDLAVKIVSLRMNENLDAHRIRVFQEKRFRKLLKYVLRKSKFYKQYYLDHGVKINSVNEIELRDLPAVNKKILMDNYDDLVCDPALKKSELEKFIIDPLSEGKKYKGIYQVIHTSGSTGTPGIFVYGPSGWNLLKAMVLTRVSKVGISPFKKIKFAFFGAVDGHYAGVSLSRDVPKLFYDFLPISINIPLEQIITQINGFSPDILAGYSSGIYLLAQEQLKGNVNIKPKRILCSADPLTPEMSGMIERAFSVPAVNFYAASESIGMAAQCECRGGLHLFNDWHIFELVDNNFNQVSSGDRGRLVVTELYNYAQPLIRYQMNDEVVFDAKPCRCGWSFPLIKNFSGRNEDYLWFRRPDNVEDFIHPGLIIELFTPGLEKVQVIQTERNRLLMKLKISHSRETVVPGIHRRMNEILEDKGLREVVAFETLIVDDIKNDEKTGKYRIIIPYRESKT